MYLEREMYLELSTDSSFNMVFIFLIFFSILKLHENPFHLIYFVHICFPIQQPISVSCIKDRGNQRYLANQTTY